MEIGGLQKTTLIDYPGKVACTVFTKGCNFRCPWCYSSELVLPERVEEQPEIPLEDFFGFLKKRKGQLEGVVICGGEPCINLGLPDFCRKLKQMGYLVKLDTNGSRPEMLRRLIHSSLVDYVAMDIKAPKAKYALAIGHTKVVGDEIVQRVSQSVALLKKGLVDYEFRTTFAPKVLQSRDILDIAQWLTPAKRYYLQNFRPEKTIDLAFTKRKPQGEAKLQQARKAVAGLFEVCEIR